MFSPVFGLFCFVFLGGTALLISHSLSLLAWESGQEVVQTRHGGSGEFFFAPSSLIPPPFFYSSWIPLVLSFLLPLVISSFFPLRCHIDTTWAYKHLPPRDVTCVSDFRFGRWFCTPSPDWRVGHKPQTKTCNDMSGIVCVCGVSFKKHPGGVKVIRTMQIQHDKKH